MFDYLFMSYFLLLWIYYNENFLSRAIYCDTCWACIFLCESNIYVWHLRRVIFETVCFFGHWIRYAAVRHLSMQESIYREDYTSRVIYTYREANTYTSPVPRILNLTKEFCGERKNVRAQYILKSHQILNLKKFSKTKNFLIVNFYLR